GPLGYIGAGWASPGVYTVNLQGTKANLRYDLDFTHWDDAHLADDYSELRSQFYGESERQKVELPRTDMFREQLEEFARAIRGEGTIEVGPQEALRSLAVVHAAIASSERDGQAVELAEVIEAAGTAAAI
ncbi:MAG: Gfo/Idh/MocA family oxidoreductase, partial [Gaiellaceae bacterium]